MALLFVLPLVLEMGKTDTLCNLRIFTLRYAQKQNDAMIGVRVRKT